MSILSKILKQRKKAQQSQSEQQAQQSQQSPNQTTQSVIENTVSGLNPSDTAGLFTSKSGAPAVENDEEKKGLFGNLRSSIFSGGISAGGGVFSFGNKRKKGLFDLFD